MRRTEERHVPRIQPPQAPDHGGAGALGVAAAPQLGASQHEAAAEVLPADDVVRLTLRVNGRSHRLLVEPRWSLLYVLRERLGTTDTKLGCGRGDPSGYLARPT